MTLENLLSENKRNYFYIMHLSYNGKERERLWNYAKEKNLVGLDYPGKVKGNWIEVRESAKKLLPKIWVRQFDLFCHKMKKGDIVVVLEGWHSILGIAKTDKKEHDFRKELSTGKVFFDHVREVEWIVKYEYGKHAKLSSPIKGFVNALSMVKQGTRRWSDLAEFSW